VIVHEKLKFGNLWQKAEALDCDYIATGISHHRNIIRGRAVLRKGSTPGKTNPTSCSVCGSATAARADSARRDVETRHPGDARS